MNQPNLSSFIWSIADLLRGDYKQSDYGKVILPFTVLRRLDCVLEATKDAVLKEKEKREAAGLNPEAFLLKKSGQLFYNVSPLDMKKLMGDQEHMSPREVIRLMVNLLFIEDDEILSQPGVVRSLYDPAVATGGMLSVAEEHLSELNPDARLVMFGKELNAESYAICKADMFYNTGISTYIWILTNRKPAHRKGKLQLIDASSFWQKMRKSLGSKRRELSEDHIAEITRLSGDCKESSRHSPSAVATNGNADGTRSDACYSVPISRISRNEDFGYHTITVERPLREESGKVVPATKGKLKGKPQPDANLRDTENVPLSEDVQAYFEREVLPHAPDPWIDHEKTKVGYEIPFNRHFYVFKPPRDLAEIDTELKIVTDRILTMIGGLSK